MPHNVELPDSMNVRFGGKRESAFVRTIESAKVPGAVIVHMLAHGLKQAGNDRYAGWTDAQFEKEGQTEADDFIARLYAGTITTRATGGDPVANRARQEAAKIVYSKLRLGKDKKWTVKESGRPIDKETINKHIATLAESPAYVAEAKKWLKQVNAFAIE